MPSSLEILLEMVRKAWIVLDADRETGLLPRKTHWYRQLPGTTPGRRRFGYGLGCGWYLSLTLHLRVACGLGAEVSLVTWRNAYPIIHIGGVLGPVSVSGELTRPDAIAIDMLNRDASAA